VLRHRSRPAAGRTGSILATLLALLLLAAIPMAAEAKNFKVDGRVTGAPAAKRGAVTVPVQLTKRVGQKLKLGTRNVRLRLNRRARLALSGSGANGASRLAPTGLRAGDRLRGVTSLSRKARRRMRYTARPTLRLKRGRVTRRAPSALAPGGGGGGGGGAAPAAPRTLEQVLNELSGKVMGLNAKVGEFGSISQQVEAKKLQLESLGTGLEGVTVAFEALTAAIEAREGTLDPVTYAALVASVEGLVLRVEALEASTGAVETTLGTLESAIGEIGGVVTELAPTAAILGSQIGLIRSFPGAEAQIMALDETLRRIEGRIGTAEAALGSLGSGIDGLNASMASLANAVNAQAAAAAGASGAAIQAGLNGLAASVGGLESGFGGLQNLNGAAADFAALAGDATALAGMAEALCITLPTACP
jgi:hypothetical protein